MASLHCTMPMLIPCHTMVFLDPTCRSAHAAVVVLCFWMASDGLLRHHATRYTTHGTPHCAWHASLHHALPGLHVSALFSPLFSLSSLHSILLSLLPFPSRLHRIRNLLIITNHHDLISPYTSTQCKLKALPMISCTLVPCTHHHHHHHYHNFAENLYR